MKNVRRAQYESPSLDENPYLSAPYDLNPAADVAADTIGAWFDELASRLRGHQCIRIDGYVGVRWSGFTAQLQHALRQCGVNAMWIDISHALRDEADINALIEPFLGGNDPLFGTRFTGKLSDFFAVERLWSIVSGDHTDCTIVFGCGAALVEWDGPLVYVDLPKHELQLRSRRGEVCNLGATAPVSPGAQYKRFYFIDWPALNRHKCEIIDKVDWFVDEQEPARPTFISGDDLRKALDALSRNVFRVRPWFEPGPWGGQWIKRRIPQLPQSVANYAWSFELITPENGLLLNDGRNRLEVSFDWLMYLRSDAVLGKHATRFQYEFPIRFDFLDTFGGGNLSLQCHPRPDYIRDHFGESFTQDETYYILDAKPDARVFLGFVDGVDRRQFQSLLLESAQDGTEFDVNRFVNSIPSHKHDLFLIPNGTIHCSGVNNLVLEISATPYIFTFKMYDWLRMGLDGLPRPLNIDRAMENLYFDRQGKRIADEFISHPMQIASGIDWNLIHLPTHQEHFYDVYRYEFDTVVNGRTEGSPLVMMLVEGTSVAVETENRCQEFSYAETFIIPAAANSYRLINQSNCRARVVIALLKSGPG